MYPQPPQTLTNLEIVFLVGFVSTFSALLTHVITKWRLSKTFVTQFSLQADYIRRETAYNVFVTQANFTSGMEQLFKQLMYQCDLNRAKCPYTSIVNEYQSLKRDIEAMRKIQIDRTEALQKHYKCEQAILRILLDKAEIPIDKQTDLLQDILA